MVTLTNYTLAALPCCYMHSEGHMTEHEVQLILWQKKRNFHFFFIILWSFSLCVLEHQLKKKWHNWPSEEVGLIGRDTDKTFHFL